MNPTAQGLGELFYQFPFSAFVRKAAAAATNELFKLLAPHEGAVNMPLAGSGKEFRLLRMHVSTDTAITITLANDDAGANAIWKHAVPVGFGDIGIPLPGRRFGDNKKIYLTTSAAFTGAVVISGVRTTLGRDINE